MRGRLERELAREAGGRIDIKLGHGGIADIEFLVQFLQITHGGALPAIRLPGAYEALAALREAGCLGEEDAAALEAAYRYLRLVENRLRITNAQPLHTFPETPEGMQMLARRFGYLDDEEGSSRAKLLADYERETTGVRRIYSRIVEGEEGAAE